MPAYSYKAFDSLVNEQIGRINADSERAARKQLKNLNLIPLEITETLKKVKRSVRVKTKALVLITRQLATLLNSSIPLDESLSIVSNHSSDDKFSKILKKHTSSRNKKERAQKVIPRGTRKEGELRKVSK